jgi:DNA-binding CsgD family transcriptional regulator
VLEHVAEGRTDREIATLLYVSVRTVHKHLEHVYEKLGVRTRAGAVAAAFRIAS